MIVRLSRRCRTLPNYSLVELLPYEISNCLLAVLILQLGVSIHRGQLLFWLTLSWKIDLVVAFATYPAYGVVLVEVNEGHFVLDSDRVVNHARTFTFGASYLGHVGRAILGCGVLHKIPISVTPCALLSMCLLGLTTG